MELLDLVSKVIDLSRKGSEYNEEIENLHLTVQTLDNAIQDMLEN